MRLLASALLLFAAAAAQAQTAPYAPPPAGTVTIYRGATLIDGTGAAPRTDMAIVTDGETIRAVMPIKDLPADTKGEIVDMRGKFVVPGLIDSHVHLRTFDRSQTEAILKRGVYSGLTAVRDMADDLDVLMAVDRDGRSGKIAASDVYAAALMAGPPFFKNDKTRMLWGKGEPGAAPWAQKITAETDIAQAVARARATGASAIKIYSDLSPALVKKIADEAHRQGMRAWAHAAVFPATPRDVIEGDVDAVSHVCHLAYQASDPFPQAHDDKGNIDASKFTSENPAVTSLFREMHNRGTVLDATNVTYVRSGISLVAPQCTDEVAFQLSRQALREGVEMSAGTDKHRSLDEPLPPLFDEIDLLVEKIGMTPLQAIRAATLVSARSAGQQATMGTIEPGKLANLLFVAQDPTSNIKNLQSIVLTVKRGARFPRSDYQPAKG